MNHAAEIPDPAEDFVMVPLVHYEQVSPTALPPGGTVRVHISGRKGSSTVLRGSKRSKGRKESVDVSRPTPELVPPVVPDSDRDAVADQLTHESVRLIFIS